MIESNLFIIDLCIFNVAINDYCSRFACFNFIQIEFNFKIKYFIYN